MAKYSPLVYSFCSVTPALNVAPLTATWLYSSNLFDMAVELRNSQLRSSQLVLLMSMKALLAVLLSCQGVSDTKSTSSANITLMAT